MQGRSDPNHQLLDAVGLVGHPVPEGSVYTFLAGHRETLFCDELFADLFPSGRGRPSVPAPVVATVMVLQSLEGLSDREAMEQLRCDLRWKVATGLALDHVGFHPTTLTYWRRRLRASDRPERIFDAVRDVIAQTGVLSRSTRRALDSTVLDDAVAAQDTITELVAQIRRVRGQVPAAGEVELAGHDDDRVGRPECDWADPAAREQLISTLVDDALTILSALEDVELDEPQAEAVGLLALVAGQDVELGEDEGSWRIARRTAKDRVISTVDPASRHVHKNRRSYRDGFKAHVSVEPDTGLIVEAALTAGNAPDGPTGVALLEREGQPVEVLADSAYSSADTLIALADAEHTTIIKPWSTRRMTSHPQAFAITDFHVDTAAGTATCPAGHTATISPAGQPGSPPAVTTVHCVAGAPPPRRARSSSSIHIMMSTPRPGPPPETRTGRTATDVTGPWSNAPSPGSYGAVTGAWATAASPPTSSGSPTAPPRSTSNASSPSD